MIWKFHCFFSMLPPVQRERFFVSEMFSAKTKIIGDFFHSKTFFSWSYVRVCEYISFLPPVSCTCTILYLHSLVFLFFYNPWFIYTNCTIVVFYIEINQDFLEEILIFCIYGFLTYIPSRSSYGINLYIIKNKLGLMCVIYCAIFNS